MSKNNQLFGVRFSRVNLFKYTDRTACYLPLSLAVLDINTVMNDSPQNIIYCMNTVGSVVRSTSHVFMCCNQWL